METLRESLKDWTELDLAAFGLARCLGLMGDEVTFSSEAKHVFWSRHPVGDRLYAMIEELIRLGVLEQRNEGNEVRWNPSFRGSWE